MRMADVEILISTVFLGSDLHWSEGVASFWMQNLIFHSVFVGMK